MKNYIIALGFWMLAGAQAAETVKTCDLGKGASQRVAVTRDSPIASTHIYYLQQGSKRVPVFGTPDQSRGASVLIQCVGKKHRALVVSGEFTANAIQGFAITSVPLAPSLERLDFAEKNRPQWLYIGASEIIVVIANLGYGETDAKYTAYRHVIGNNENEPASAINELPSSNGFEVARLVSRPK